MLFRFETLYSMHVRTYFINLPTFTLFSSFSWEQAYYYRALCQRRLLEEIKEGMTKKEYDAECELRPLGMEIRARHMLEPPANFDSEALGFDWPSDGT